MADQWLAIHDFALQCNLTSAERRAKGVAKFVRYNKVSLKSRFFFIYFTITGVKKIVRYPEVFVIDEVRYIEDQLYSDWN